MKAATKLKVCYFCRNVDLKVSGIPGGYFWVHCSICGEVGPARRSRESAIASWNRAGKEKDNG